MKKTRFSAASLVCGVLSLATALLYALSVSRDHSPVVIACMILAGLCSLALCRKKVPFAEYLPFALVLVSIGVFTRLGFDEIGDILSKNNMNGLSWSWICSAFLLIASGVANGICTVFAAEKE